jgi:heme/copper-type cytochrome/quinol oxidase subunit 3
VTADPAAIATLGSDRLRPTRRRGYSTAWWGMATVIMTEGTIFLALLASYFFLRASASEWPLDGIELPKLGLSVPFSLVLWASSGPIFVAESAIRRGNVRRLRAGLFITFVMGAAFVGYSAFDFQELRFGWRDNAYGSIYYTIVGLHLAHVVVGLLMNLVVQAKAWLGKLDRGRHVSVEVYSLYWHFVDVVWVFVFPSLFLSPHLQ